MAGDLIAGRYRLLEPLGRGGLSSVWLANDEELDRRVAVKTLAPAADPVRFEREAVAVAMLAHPNICALYDYGDVDGDRHSSCSSTSREVRSRKPWARAVRSPTARRGGSPPRSRQASLTRTGTGSCTVT